MRTDKKKVMSIKRKKDNINTVGRQTGRKGGRRGCLCWDENRYHPDCCDGTLRAQGVGKTRA